MHVCGAVVMTAPFCVCRTSFGVDNLQRLMEKLFFGVKHSPCTGGIITDSPANGKGKLLLVVGVGKSGGFLWI